MALTDQQKVQVIEEIITNCSCGEEAIFNENDAELLAGTPDERLLAIHKTSQGIALNAQVAAAAKEGNLVSYDLTTNQFIANEPGDFSEKKGGGVQKTGEPDEDDIEGGGEDVSQTALDKKKSPAALMSNQKGSTVPKTTKQYLEDLPAEVRSIVSNALAFDAQQRTDLVNQIITNAESKGIKLTKEMFAGKDLNELRVISALSTNQEAQQPQPRQQYLGAAAGQLATNVGGPKFDEDDILPLPKMDYTENASSAIVKQNVRKEQAPQKMALGG